MNDHTKGGGLTFSKQELNRRYYEKHKEELKKNQREYGKKTNWVADKTDNEKAKRRIRARTRAHFPLFKAIKCELCPQPATEHHHYSMPIEINKFNYVCHECHRTLNTMEVK